MEGRVGRRMGRGWRTFPTAASPSRTSLTLLLGLGALGAGESDIAMSVLWIDSDGGWCGPLGFSWWEL